MRCSRPPGSGCEPLAFGQRYNGTPFLLTEFGGIAFLPSGARPASEKEWGYSGIEPTEEAFLARLAGLVGTVRSSPIRAGFCHRQLTGVEQEINGLMTFDRRPKVAPERCRAIFAPQLAGGGRGSSRPSNEGETRYHDRRRRR